MRPTLIAPPRLIAFFMTGLVLAACSAPPPGPQEQLEQSLAAMGGVEVVATRGLSLHGQGEVDLAARLQGHTARRPDTYPAEERLSVSQDGRVAYETHQHVNADADEHLRYLIADQGVALVDRLGEAAFWLDDVDPAEEGARYRRTVPHLLIAQALDHPLAVTAHANPYSVNYTTPEGDALVLVLDPDTRLLREVRFQLDLPLRGTTTVRRVYDDYVDVPGLGRFPAGYRIMLGDDTYKRISYSEIGIGATEPLHSPPEGIGLGPAPETIEAASPLDERPLPEPREFADGVYLLPNVRPGFHHLIVEQADGLVVVDAPAGWFELQQVPAKNWVSGAPGDSVGRRMLAALQQHFPDAPVKALVLTHHHSDHAGGLPAFVEHGVPIYATAETIAALESVLGSAVAGAVPVSGGHRISDRTGDGDLTVELIAADGNPHAEGMLMVWVPSARILYQSDLFIPIPMDFFPDQARVPVMRWFVDWLDGSGLDPERIYAVHGMARVTEEQLEAMR